MDLCRVQNIAFHPHQIDSVALSILQPASAINIKLIRTLADGNCLFNAASMALSGSVKLAAEVRLHAAIELILNSEYYGNHPIVTNANIPLKFQKRENANESRTYDAEAIFTTAVFSSKACTVLNKHGFRSALEHEIRNTLHLGCFSGILQIMRLSSAIGCQIKMVYPDERHTMHPLLNGIYSPRMPVEKQKEENYRIESKTISIMWTFLQGWADRLKEFNVNHFVLLTNVSEHHWVTVSRTKKSEENPGKNTTVKRPSTPTAARKAIHKNSSEDYQTHHASPTNAYSPLKPAAAQRSKTLEKKNKTKLWKLSGLKNSRSFKTRQKKMYSTFVPSKPTKTDVKSPIGEPSKIYRNCNVKQTKMSGEKTTVKRPSTATTVPRPKHKKRNEDYQTHQANKCIQPIKTSCHTTF